MLYASFGILALVLHVIINYDVLVKNDYRNEAIRPYRHYLVGLLFFYILDISWGLIYETKMVPLVYANTLMFFLSMVVSVALWTRYVVAYLNRKGRFSLFLSYSGWIILGYEVLHLIINFFRPVIFWVEDDGTYHPLSGRYVTLSLQVVLFLVASVYSLVVATRTEGNTKLHHRTIGVSGIAMSAFVILQTSDPMLPYYSIGCMLGTALLHTFVLEDEKEEQKKSLEDLLEREKRHKQELLSARQMAYTDSLTGVKNKHSYFEAETSLDSRIASDDVEGFAVVVFDLNDLKLINDTKGHDEGDNYICEACRLICTIFDHSPVFRIGGDEFVAILENSDFEHRFELLADFDAQIEENIKAGAAVVASGMSDFRKETDDCYQPVFERADKKMYERKYILKEMASQIHA
ncbi:MAG: GGDEF domain-containing protein [Lachnospiraceae bacterium]|nr:GGDEF domain-containing protein [Lachnospiraceae bacterium]